KTAPINVTVDTTTHVTITGVTDDHGSKQGLVANGGKTDDDSVVLTGTAEPNSTIYFTRHGANGGSYNYSCKADNTGHWELKQGYSANGWFNYSVYSVDVAGNKSATETYKVEKVANEQDTDTFKEDFNSHTNLTFRSGSLYDFDHFDVKVNNSGATNVYSPGINATQYGVSQRPSSKAMVLSKGSSVTLNMDEPLSSIAFQIGDMTTTEKLTVTYMNEKGQVIHTDTYDKYDGLLTTASYTASPGQEIDSIQLSFTNTNPYAGINMTYCYVDNITGTYASSSSVQAVHMSAEDIAQAQVEADQSQANLTEHQQQELSQHATLTLSNHSQDTVTLEMSDVLSYHQQNLLIQDGKQQIAIQGDKGDVVELKVDTLAENTWHDAGQATSAGVTYEVYQHAGSDIEVLVQHGVDIHLVA
ncbi:MAG: Ig-like domain-containing protein, partial [Scandinavium sp.]|uniref:Ig-like domain-containing protein n=1 Tax=Scandinavium sp. TaxID=2830653 RepID=UPI003F37726D